MTDEDRRLVDFQRSDRRQVLLEVLTQAEGRRVNVFGSDGKSRKPMEMLNSWTWSISGVFLRDFNALNASFGRIDTEWSAVSSSLKSPDMDLQKCTERLRKILSDLDKPLYRIGDQLTDLRDGLQRSERLEVI
jgi:hypothetical protein